MFWLRTDDSIIGRWWWTVDRWVLIAVGILSFIGVILVQAGSPEIAKRQGFDSFHLVEKHLIIWVIGWIILFALSLTQPRTIRLIGLLGFVSTCILAFVTLFIGTEVKGATRWLDLPGIPQLQPSEFLKPCFAITIAWLLAKAIERPHEPWRIAAWGVYFIAISLLLAQPDVGMTIVVSAIWLTQMVLAGLPWLLIGALAALGVAGFVLIYFTFPHVTSRFDRFLDPASGDQYQISRSLEAFKTGGWFGTGPSEGTVKLSLPDSHTDFIFSVAGEELGFLLCFVVVLIYGFITLRSLWRVRLENDLFVIFAISGLLTQFCLQALINMGSTLALIPTKGMTLPFVSYGGSSFLGIAIGMGMVLALTRKRYAS